ncbi:MULTISPECIES: restriction endonuclease subunit S [Staphylococcus]|uniref:restriction endonuclease subunit S n=1 Tax=Staphylococcus TaxID=1279 RepID=UPI00070486D5|nr:MULTISPECIES: restriction endonuclease subunit S [Staphylococcus]ALM58396.1 hypothetical protein SE1039_26130 [Staphylococcus equorum]
MTNEIKNIPQLRFPNFDGDWEECKLEEISDKVTEKNKNNQFSETLTNSAEYGVISQRDFFDKDISNEKNLNGYYIVQEDDFVYNPRISNFAPVGPIKRNKLGRTGVMSPLYYVFRTRNIDVVFLDYYFETTGWHKFMKLNGDSGARADRFAIKDLIFKTMPIPYPIIEEQEKIGNFFSKLDRQIELEEQKLSLLEEQKKGYMQKIFSQELRFKDANGNDYPDWKKEKLDNILEFESERTKVENEYPVLTSSRNGLILQSEYYKEGKTFADSNIGYFIIPKGYITYRSRSDDGKFQFNLNNIIDVGIVSKYYPVFRGINMNQSFLTMLMNHQLKKEYIKFATGTSQLVLSQRNLREISTELPITEEQEKLGNFFDKQNSLIEKQSNKVELLKERKKGFLQKMFI